MARSRRAKQGAKPHAPAKTSAKQSVPDVYREMLADAVTSSPAQLGDEGRAVKRRRVGGRVVTRINDEPAVQDSDRSSRGANNSDIDELFEDVKPNQQHIIQTDSEDSADSDLNWEEVKLGDQSSQGGTPEPESANEDGIDLVLKRQDDGDQRRATSGRAKRKPVTAEEKKLRLEIHKMHLCCLLIHVHIRNHWCNDEEVFVGFCSFQFSAQALNAVEFRGPLESF